MPLRPCLDCGRPSQGSRCPEHQAVRDRADNARRHAIAVEHGLHTPEWRRLKRDAMDRDGGLCRDCGDPATSVHIDPKLGGDHSRATLDDCTSLCARCHGKRDGGRAWSGSRPARVDYGGGDGDVEILIG